MGGEVDKIRIWFRKQINIHETLWIFENTNLVYLENYFDWKHYVERKIILTRRCWFWIYFLKNMTLKTKQHLTVNKGLTRRCWFWIYFLKNMTLISHKRNHNHLTATSTEQTDRNNDKSWEILKIFFVSGKALISVLGNLNSFFVHKIMMTVTCK